MEYLCVGTGLLGNENEVCKYHQMMNEYFDCDNVGELQEYVACKIERNESDNCLMIKQPVIIKSFIDKFDAIKYPKVECPASKNEYFCEIAEGDSINETHQKIY
jgi:hypothetical protein